MMQGTPTQCSVTAKRGGMGWDGGWGREVQEGGDIYVPMADSC